LYLISGSSARAGTVVAAPNATRLAKPTSVGNNLSLLSRIVSSTDILYY
jgi:hypothetical protein